MSSLFRPMQTRRMLATLPFLTDFLGLEVAIIGILKVNLVVFGPSMVCHIRAFRTHFHVSSIFFLPGAKRPSRFTNVTPRTCGAGNLVNNIALIYFFRAKFGSRKFLLESLRMPQSLTSPIIATSRPLSPGIPQKLLTLTITLPLYPINIAFF